MHFTIVGTGVSALLLAKELLQLSCCERLTLVGPRAQLRAHLLSYWAGGPTPFDPFELASWSRIRVVAGGLDVTGHLEHLRYRTVSARAWAHATLNEIVSEPRVEWVQGRTSALDDDLVRPAVVVGGRRLESDFVFTSAPRPSTYPDAWQRFEGWLVEAPAAQLDERCATLMDFRTPAGGELRFVYVLPLGEGRVFVEHVSHRPCHHGQALSAYVKAVLGLRAYRVIDRESGATPLWAGGLPRPEGRIVPIGVAAGRAKAATGYAAMRMWRDARAIAAELDGRGEPPLRLSWPSLYRVADQFFIDLLRRQPGRVEELLSALFARAPADDVLAFLDEQATPAQQARVALAMPQWLRWALLDQAA